jgi:hypothetical protein
MRDDDAARERDAAPDDDETTVEEAAPEASDGEGSDRQEAERGERDREEPDDEREPEGRIGSRERAVRDEEERRGVPRTTTIGDPATDVRQPGDGAITDLEADAGEDPSLPDELRRGRRRAPPTGRTPPDDEPDG